MTRYAAEVIAATVARATRFGWPAWRAEREIRVQQRRPFGDVRQDNGLAHFLVAAANARPALSALAGMCVLPVEVVRVLTKMARPWIDVERAALAAAEAEVRRVDGRQG